MPIDIDIAHVARLARLTLNAEELETYRRQLGLILEHAAKVQALAGQEPGSTEHPLGLSNAFREDVVTESLDRAEVLAAAPDANDEYFIVPPALETP